MNIIEDIWDALLHAVEKRSPPPRTPMDLLTALQDSWCEFPPGYLQTLVESMPRRFVSLLRAREGPTRYKEGVQVFLPLQGIRKRSYHQAIAALQACSETSLQNVKRTVEKIISDSERMETACYHCRSLF
ncbi:hypothetical protein AVEN_132631-1 [Araneus ventricosus]|uniref:Uncharacterized protein n=1 Tax=Araneus ventricosus TaxID=182803 RepID=A0A4Y2AW16_ARAVE|nr:hypothetical protein AVEN_132631-1 [Araneus ventricosus]